MLRYLLSDKVVGILAFWNVKHAVMVLNAGKFVGSVGNCLQDFHKLLLVVHQETCINVGFVIYWVFNI